jgi:hypothetical protein
MRRMVPILVFLFCVAMAGAAFADSQINDFRCGSGLVRLGDSKYKVEHTCGQPYGREETGGGYHRGFPAGDWSYTEKWTYNMGPRDYVYELVFTAGDLVEIRRGGRGF